MRKRWYLFEIETQKWTRARSFEHALELAAASTRAWRVMVRIGAGDPILVRHGVNRAA